VSIANVKTAGKVSPVLPVINIRGFE